ncbi:MAG: autotransporter domain-containing protein, partial [Parachlamydiaceae bacterium]
AVTQSGSAVLTLAGNNTYGGLTTINSGGLTFTGDTSGMTGNIVNNAALTFDQAANSAFQGGISGAGTLTKNGAGTLTLQGINSYSGNTVVAAGALRAGVAGAFSSSSSVIMDNTSGAVLDLNGFNQTIVSLSGGGGTGGNISLGSATLTTGNSGNTVYGGVISGGGGVTKVGSGILSLTGANTFTGIMQVLSGELNLNGSVGGNMSIASGTLLTGDGTVGGSLVISSGGTISPGNSIGTFHVLGNFTNNGGNYLVEINGAGASDMIDVGGTATLNGGSVIVTSVDGTYSLTDVYTILTASSVTGTYSSVVVNGLPIPPALLKPSLTYDAQHVYFTLQGTTPKINFMASTCNELAVALQIESILANPTNEQAVLIHELVGLPALEVQAALDSLTGQQHTDDLLSTSIINRQFIRRLYDPVRPVITAEPCRTGLGSASGDNEFDCWLEAGAGHTHLNGDGNAHGFNLNSYEVTCGMQDTFCSDWTVGLAGGYEYDQFIYEHKGKGSSKTVFAGMYGLYRPSRYYALLDVAYGGSSNVVDRPIDVGSVHYRVRSNPKISQLTCYGEVGVDFNFGRFLMQPFAGVEIGSYWRKRVVERPVAPSTGGWELVVNERDRTNVYSRLGLHLTANELPYRFAVSLDIAWVKRLTCGDNALTMRFVEFGTDFNINGVPLNGNSADAAITISTQPIDQLRFYIEASGEVWNEASTYNGLGGFEFIF